MWMRRALAAAWLWMSVAVSLHYCSALERTVDRVAPRSPFDWISTASHGGPTAIRAAWLLFLLWAFAVPIVVWSVRRWE